MSYRGLLAELLLAECDDRARRRSERRITAAKFPARSPYAASTSRPTQHRSRGRPHPGQVRVGQEGPAAGLDRGLWQRQVPSPDRARHRGCDIRLPCQVPAGHQARQRTGRGRRREDAVEDHRALRTGRSAVHRRTRVHAAGPPRRRAALSGPDRARGECVRRDRVHESFSGWTKTVTDSRLCAAIVDRLTFGGTIIETGTDSYRLAQRTKLVNT